MPYVIISTQIRLVSTRRFINDGINRDMQTGPTTVGDEWSDKGLMDRLGASLEQALGNNFKEYITQDTPRIVMNKLQVNGYKLMSSCGIGQTCTWTFYKD